MPAPENLHRCGHRNCPSGECLSVIWLTSSCPRFLVIMEYVRRVTSLELLAQLSRKHFTFVGELRWNSRTEGLARWCLAEA